MPKEWFKGKRDVNAAVNIQCNFWEGVFSGVDLFRCLRPQEWKSLQLRREELAKLVFFRGCREFVSGVCALHRPLNRMQ